MHKSSLRNKFKKNKKRVHYFKSKSKKGTIKIASKKKSFKGYENT